MVVLSLAKGREEEEQTARMVLGCRADQNVDLGHVQSSKAQRGGPVGMSNGAFPDPLLQQEMGCWQLQISWDLQPGHQGKSISWHLGPERHIPIFPSCAPSGRKAFPFLEVSKMQHRKTPSAARVTNIYHRYIQ